MVNNLNFKYISINNGKYDIFCKIYTSNSRIQKYIIACHGFGGDKESSAIYELAKESTKHGIDVISFDFPEHGESKLYGGDYFRVDNCISDLKSVYDYVKYELHANEINIFATSFGAYITIHAIMQNKINPSKIVLRAPAIKMHEIFKKSLIKESMNVFKNNKKTILGFEKKLVVNYEYYLDLEKNQIITNNNLPEMLIIQGSDDDIAPIKDTKEFIKINKDKFKLIEIEGADHRFKKPGEIEKVINYTVNYFYN